MSDLILDLAERGRALTPQERERLVELLLETLVEPAAWNREIESRIAGHKRGEVETFDVEDVLAEAHRIAP